MTPPLPKFVIVVDGKPFIKGYEKGETPNQRVDFEFKKLKMRSFKMCIEKDQLETLASKSAVQILNHPAYPNLTPEQIEEIIKGQGHQLVC